MTTRTDLATAASSVAGVKVTPYYRQNLTPGNGFVRLGAKNKPSNGFGWLDTWEVWIAVPSNIEDAEKWIESKSGTLLDALEAEMLVQSLTPMELTIGSITSPGIVVSGVREG